MEEALLLPEKRETLRRRTWNVYIEAMKKVSYIALPMLMVNLSQHLVRIGSMMMIGHLGELSLSGASVATSLTNVTGFSLVLGMASALETLCGQAYGAEQYNKLGIYTTGAIISLLIVCIPISILWLFIDKILIFLGQDPLISIEAAKYSIWLIAAVFPYVILQALIRYLQTQSLILPMVLSSVATLCFHVPICWLLIFKLNVGSCGAAVAIGLSYWFNVLLLGLYVKYSSSCEKTRLCFSSEEVFASIREFFPLAIPSACMVCLEWWTFEIVILLAGLLPKPQLETSVLSICMSVASTLYFIPFSLGAGASTRVSNELGAGNPEGAKMAIRATLKISMAAATICSSVLFCSRHVLGYAFSNEKEVVDYLRDMTPFLCVLIVSDCIQAVLSGVARGSGWQHLGAYVNLGSFYLVGMPVAILSGFVLHFQGKGLWFGLNVGNLMQSFLLSLITSFTDWKRQASKARERICY
ncbi:PREDICTED: protein DETOXIFICATION 14-like isoform X2 [Nicotiana attenuata]|uniref:Protein DETOXIFICATION n=1 Tax=Nicotiana attenuata TaxID=49451 RepID=A0A1J6JXN4_NICAT|nr:PREDICTED: protein DETOXIFICATION 14-like isoform X2 [Nicotiana attenuata]OIT21870.1 protein detoxification 14 [Nicotiana attenuata]